MEVFVEMVGIIFIFGALIDFVTRIVKKLYLEH